MIEQALCRFLEGLVPGDPIDEHSSLIDGGLLDSVALVELVDHIEITYSIALENSDLDADNFESVQRIASMIRRHDIPTP